MLRTICIGLFFSPLLLAQALSNDCNICVDIATRCRKSGSDSEVTTKAKALMGANSYSGDDQTEYINELNCHWDKYYNDANSRTDFTALSTCADTGRCPISYQESAFDYVDITNSTTEYGTKCVVPKIILIHHTVTTTAEETINTLLNRGLSVQYIVAKNGTIYQMVNDWHRAYHAGIGHWREVADVNSNSIGIEIVNTGSEPFPDPQVQSVFKLVAALRDRWFVKPSYVIGHMDVTPSRKDDPSGYFPWQGLNEYLNILPGLFTSKLTPAEQQEVLIGNTTTGLDLNILNRVQQGLLQYGYNSDIMTPNVLDENTKDTFQSFNRHYCPEVFIKEVENVTEQSNILNPLNQQWYKLSDERLTFLLNTMQ